MSIRRSKKIYIIKRINDFRHLLREFQQGGIHPSAVDSELNALSWEYDSIIYLIDSYNDFRYIKDNSVVKSCAVISSAERDFFDDICLSMRENWNSFVSDVLKNNDIEKYSR